MASALQNGNGLGALASEADLKRWLEDMLASEYGLVRYDRISGTPDGLAPTGAAGGVLSGSFPNPDFAVDMATQAELNAESSTRAAADALLQPLDTDLTAIAALTTTSFGRSFLDRADAAAARTLIGTVIGTDVQAHDADLDALAALTTQAFGRSLLTAASSSAARSLLGLVIGTDVQAYDAELAALAGLTSAADKLPYFTGSGTAATTDLSPFARTILAGTTAGAVLTTLGAAALAGGNTFTGTQLIDVSGGSASLDVSDNYSTVYAGVVANATSGVGQLWAYNATGHAADPIILGGLWDGGTSEFTVLGSGQIEWSDGTNPPDVNLRRISATNLGSDYKFNAQGFILDGSIAPSPHNVGLWIDQGWEGTDSGPSLAFYQDDTGGVGSPNAVTETAMVVAGWNNGIRFLMDYAGTMKWGDGTDYTTTTFSDVEIARTGVGELTCDGVLLGDNLPTQDQKNALAGTRGTPSTFNKYVTDQDPRVSIFAIELPDAILSLTPEMYLKLGASSGLTDQSGNGNDGTASGGITIGGGPILSSEGGTSTDFDTVDDKITTSYAPFASNAQLTFVGFHQADSITVQETMWTSDGTDTVAMKQGGGGGTGRDVTFSIKNGGTTLILTWNQAWPNIDVSVAWALTYDDSTNEAELFIQGTSRGRQTIGQSFGASPGNIQIGNTDTNGKMSNFAVYESVLSASSCTWIQGVGLGHVLRDWGIVNELPDGAIYNDTCTYVADETNGVFWNLIYDGFGSYPWKYVGGPPLEQQSNTQRTISATSMTNVPTDPLTITLPLAGDYDVEIFGTWNQVPAGEWGLQGYSIAGVTGTTSNGQIMGNTATNGLIASGAKRSRITGAAASTVLREQAQRSAGASNAALQDRRLWAMPVRVG